MGTKKKLVLPEEYLPLESDLDFEVSIEIVESESFDARLSEFVKLTGKAIFEYTGRLDTLLEESGETFFYEKYGAARRGKAAVQKARRLTEAAERAEKEMEKVRQMVARLQESFAEFEKLGENPTGETSGIAAKTAADFEREMSRVEKKIAKLLEQQDLNLNADLRDGDDS